MTSMTRGLPLTAEEAIRTRRSIRAFLPREVPRADIERILESAGRAPSGTNTQPWQVVVLTGQALQSVKDRLEARALAGDEGRSNYRYYPEKFRDPYLARRRQVGWALYSRLGIEKGDKARMNAQNARNFRFFDAPVGMFFLIDADLELGSWLDCGMFIQNVMVAARGLGLDTCPQAAFIRYHEEIAAMLGLGADRKLICGLSLGHADPDAPENDFVTEREPVAAFTTFMDRLPG